MPGLIVVPQRRRGFYMSKIHEECGIFGIYSKETTELAGSVYYGLFSLQH